MTIHVTRENREALRRLSSEYGFELCGFAALTLSALEKERYRTFVAEGRHGTMSWFQDQLHLRLEPAALLPGAETAMVLAARYGDERYESLAAKSAVLVSRYAVGRDYHRLLRRRGARLLGRAKELLPGLAGRVVVDSAPVPEKALARSAGIAWQGKHTNMIHPRFGSYFFLAVILLKATTEPDAPIHDRCGQCRLCLDACPTGALEPYRLDARLCISYLTIETKAPIPPELSGRLNRWVFGCDICQEVCPYNSPTRTIPDRAVGGSDFRIRDEVAALMTEGALPALPSPLFEGSALGRAGPERLSRNMQLATEPGS